jgi:tetratricopeptide (TPR) repeat protein
MKKKQTISSKEKELTLPPPASEKFYHSLKNQFIILVLLVIGFYGNTLFNEYALDDVVSITGNKFTQKGFKGISTLFFKDSFYGYFGNSAELSGGRWRPLALITFAIEHQFFGDNPTISHLNNVLIYLLTAITLLLFLRKHIFKQLPLLAFVTTILFVIHPIHTEVVANIKSRDELLSFYFLLLTLYFSFNYLNDQAKKLPLFLSCLFYFLALISKENGLTFIAILPLSFYFFGSETIKKCFLNSIPFIAVAAIYLFMRISFVGFNYVKIHDVNVSPLSNATTIEWWATIFLALGKYISLLFFPHPLSADYSYNQIPYVDFTNVYVWISIIFQSSLLIYAFIQLKNKNMFSYAILFYFFSIFIVSNLVIDIGATLGERFLYQASLGFCMCIALLLFYVHQKTATTIKHLTPTLLIGIILLSAVKTISRNSEWKNDQTLFVKDVETCPNSIRTNIAAGSAYIIFAQSETDSVKRIELLHKSIAFNEKALSISPAVDPILNLGVAYFNLGNYDMAAKMWKDAESKGRGAEVQQYKKALSINLMNQGLSFGNKKEFNNSILYFYKAIDADATNHEAWYNLGGAYYTIARYDSAVYAWNKTLALKPDYENAIKGLEAAKNNLLEKKKN